jgi:hypothetical protein
MCCCHYRVLYDDEALATTIDPDRWGKLHQMQARWKRSWCAKAFFAGSFFLAEASGGGHLLVCHDHSAADIGPLVTAMRSSWPDLVRAMPSFYLAASCS